MVIAKFLLNIYPYYSFLFRLFPQSQANLDIPIKKNLSICFAYIFQFTNFGIVNWNKIHSKTKLQNR